MPVGLSTADEGKAQPLAVMPVGVVQQVMHMDVTGIRGDFRKMPCLLHVE